MLITKTTPIGIDLIIQNYQALLHAEMLTAFGLNTDLWHCYGRAYRNKTSDGYSAEVYDNASGDYKDVYWNDDLAMISFFGLEDGMEFTDHLEDAIVHLIVFADLNKVKPGIPHRGDEEVRREFLKFARSGMYGFTAQSIDLSIENVLREYPGSRRDDRLKYVDMHPVHCFRINFLLSFDALFNPSTI